MKPNKYAVTHGSNTVEGQDESESNIAQIFGNGVAEVAARQSAPTHSVYKKRFLPGRVSASQEAFASSRPQTLISESCETVEWNNM